MSENRKQAAISSVCTSKPLPPKNHSRPPQGVQMAVFNNNWKWDRNHDVIKVHFMQKSKHCGQGYILKCASEWSNRCRIKFEECPKRSESDIRIDFENTGNWSYVGASACHADLIEKATMNLGIACSENILPSEVELRGTILHEFGHVLGFLHEHQSPKSDLKWNREKVIKYYSRAPNNWTMDEIESNILVKLDEHRQGLDCTAWDPKSIMHYGFASEFLLDRDGRGIAECYELSAMDIEKVAEVYSVSQQQQQQNPSPVSSGYIGNGCLEDIPKISSVRDLAGRPSTDDLRSISRAAGQNKKDLLRYLGIEEARIYTLYENNPNNAEEACYKGLLFWEKAEARKPVTWDTLKDALNKAELTDLADGFLYKLK